MPLYEMTPDSFRPLSRSSFAEQKVKERGDIQRLLRTQIEVLGDDLYVLVEEFGDWDDSRRRIDLLAIDLHANLVVIELKRTNDGGHMELQALRYASMISTMTFEQAVAIHAEFLAKMGIPAEQSQSRILAFLGWEDPEEEAFAPDVRIMLVSEDFGKELTTAVLWLRDRDIDIRCVRLRPYSESDRLFVDVQQVIPLPEANDYQIQLRQKEQSDKRKRSDVDGIRLRFWQGLVAEAKARNTRHREMKPGAYHYMGASSGIRGLSYNYVILQHEGFVELYIDRGQAPENKRIFDHFHSHKEEIEKLFGTQLVWERLDAKQSCRIKYPTLSGGHRSPENDWPKIYAEMVSSMNKLEHALKPGFDTLKV